ncbi:Ubiquitin-conjugating enzyme E2 2, partial [Conglomerata obtusa]
MSTPAKRRLIKDLTVISRSNESVFAQPLDNDLFTWCSIIIGPSNTPFEDGTFTLLLSFDESYPFNPPAVKFISRMFHPNIYDNGDLCLDILKTKWSPTYDVLSVLLSVQSLLNDANCDSPANLQAADVMKDKDEYEKRVRACVLESWSDVEKILDAVNNEKM